MERILVTGAGGYIGLHVISELLDMGYAVTAVDIKQSDIDKRANLKLVDIFTGEKDLYEKLDSPSRLIHLAWKDGFIHNSSAHLEFLPKHYEFIKNMVDSGCKSISVMGSMHEIGYYEGAIDENTPTNPSSLYGISKNALRQALEAMQKTVDFSLHWLRGFYICGDDRKNNSIFAKLLQKSDAGEKEFPFTTGTNKYDFINVDQLALQIALSSVQDEILGTINCCSGNPVALRDKVEQFIKENNLDIKLKYGVYPDRPYDSKIIYGNNERIKKILMNSCDLFSEAIKPKIIKLLEQLA